MRTFAIGTRSSYKIRNANPEGFFVAIRGIGSAVNTDPVLVPDQLRITAKLNQGNFNDTIVDGLVVNLWRGTRDKKDYAGDETYQHYRVVTAKDAGTAGVLEWSYQVKFPTVINLNGDDSIDVEVDFPSGSLTSAANTSYVGVEEIEGVGSQFYIPKIKEYVLPALETSYEQYLGDNVIHAVMCGDASNKPTEDGLLKIEVFSDRRNEVLAIERLALMEAETTAEGLEFINCELDQVKVKCTMDGTLNAAGDLRLVVTSYYTDAVLVAEGKARQERHLRYAKRKIA